jgi:UDP-GlcNAc:undecaprenyl-phosphate/decaprenyl-phosphate GlcNAc-1-phosphate transferase
LIDCQALPQEALFSMTSRQLFLFLFASLLPPFVVALITTGLMRWLSPRWGLVDQPNQRKVHTKPIPLGGGVGIWLGVIGTFAAGSLAAWIVSSDAAWLERIPAFAHPHLSGVMAQLPKLWILLAAGTVLMMLGLADDRWGLSWQLRMATQFGVAAACVYLVPNLRLTAFIDQPWFTGALSVLWIVALINSVQHAR